MRDKGNQVQFFNKALLAILFFINIGYSTVYSQDSGQPIIWDSNSWHTDNETNVDKDLFYPPVTAYIESSVLYIRNDKPSGSLDIAIVSGKSGRVVWNQVYPEAATSLVAIPLDTLPAGEYSLQVMNEWGGYVCGFFRK